MKQVRVKAGNAIFSNDAPLVYISGPCVIESLKSYAAEAAALKAIFRKLGASFVLKASFDKANRTSHSSFRGIPMETALAFLKDLKNRLNVPILIDVHEPSQAARVAEVADILQIPAFLCRQTDLLFACADTGKAVNVKKGQFLAPWDMQNIIAKIESRGNRNILLTERGTSFGYNNLVVDMRGLEIMKGFNYPVIFDCTHSVQKPGALGKATGGDAKLALPLAKAAAALKLAGIFFEAHPDPEKALSDGPNSFKLDRVPGIVRTLNQIDKLALRIKKSQDSGL
ncbi:MAG: 3-deoxy-8-phosphooctulonate synthase [Elusimicrobia bacterium RIFOXYA12_FULL_51_18]|nr:MAG: 3-deoxy-8-phosphooctulonate synthase [Elusimicrobia bacterium RIFOXYA12_FULL_51_18]OGS29954.1 MAG: 3-deoxy-8-phosphooctulonate synthase [Elusimicrobia bacterium RIFOXYA2_FULL_53_38]